MQGEYFNLNFFMVAVELCYQESHSLRTYNSIGLYIYIYIYIYMLLSLFFLN
jgi:hypothetical protein